MEWQLLIHYDGGYHLLFFSFCLQNFIKCIGYIMLDVKCQITNDELREGYTRFNLLS